MNIGEINKIREENRLLNEQEIKEKKIILKSKPQNILLILNNTCNLKCVMCKDYRPSKYIIPDLLFNDIMDNMKFFESFSCQGGEPLLFHKFDSIVDKAKEFYTHLNITTNGQLLKENLLKKMCNLSVTIHISIDGFDKETYEGIRKGASFDILKDNLKNLKSIKKEKGFEELKYELFMVPQKLNYTQVCKAMDFAKLYDFVGIRFMQVRGFKKDSFMLNDEEYNIVKKQIYECINLSNNEKVRIDTDIPMDYENTPDLKDYLIKDFNDICLVPWKSISIQKFGNVSLDCLCNFSRRESVNTLEEAWNSKYIQDIRKGLIEKKPISSCRNCYKNNLYKENEKYGK